VPWEPWISGRHVELLREGDRLHVRQLPDARNPVFFRGEPVSKLSLQPGECFVIGTTIFTVSSGGTSSVPERRPVVHSYTVSASDLQQIPFRDAPHRIDVLGHLTKVISSITDETELFVQTVNLLLEGIRKADAIALVAVEVEGNERTVRVLHSDRRLAAEVSFQPSKRLTCEAIARMQKSVVHVWSDEAVEKHDSFTLQGDFDWAFCTPLPGDACKGMGIYVAGRLTGTSPTAILAPWESNDLSEDVKFAELVAAIVGALRQMQVLQHRQSVLSHFFSPSVLRVLSTTDPETALKPRETEVTVLFCDLRGFSRKVEMAADNLAAILDRVSTALGVMSTCILEHKGAIADFLGDCAIGFWGWPLGQADDIPQACLAALKIRAAFNKFAGQAGHPLADFKVGIGIATGRAVAGQIGSRDQAKVTVFGPVVNLASRLEGLTKILRVPVLLDEATARAVAEKLPPDAARCRRLARIKPLGLENPLMVSELIPPSAEDPLLTDEHLDHYESALTAFLEGRWGDAYERLHHIPPQDLGKDLLISFILQHNHTPPAAWDGVIPMHSKS
jgi:adenylate cyclase